jgi:hypothetical protein
MEEGPKKEIKAYLSRLDSLIRRGQQLIGMLANALSDQSAIADTRRWQEDCGVTINQLSGGSKAHWLARSFSEAFLMRSSDGGAAEEATPVEIVKRLLGVLEQAIASLSGMANGADVFASSEADAAPHRFDFVHNVELRPVVEQAYTDSRRAFEQGAFELALNTTCGILEAIVTDALEYRGVGSLPASDLPAVITDWPFKTRLVVAERAGLIKGGCARLPAIAWTYRDHTKGGPKVIVSKSDARRAGQVLHVVIRDLNPGR